MRGKLPVLLSLSLPLGLLAAACAEDQPAIQAESGGDHEDEGEGHEAQGTKEIGGEEATYHGTTDISGMTEFTMEADDNYFGPTILEGEAGQRLSLALYNEGGVDHTFTIDEAVIDEELTSGADGTSVDVTFPESGALVFYCRFHRDQGMLGALSVGGSLETAGGAEDSGGSSGGYG
ncbi:MAG: cupredoxin domain-containing protein [Actinomycetota bacterium]